VYEDVVCECANDSCRMPMILHRPSPSTIAAAAGVAAGVAAAVAAAPAAAAATNSKSPFFETWEQYTARIPFYPLHFACSPTACCLSHDAASMCTVCHHAWSSHDPSSHSCPAPPGGTGSFEVQTDAFVACQFCSELMCEACLKPVAVTVSVPLISILGVTRSLVIRHTGLPCHLYFSKVAAARHRAGSSSASLAQSESLSPEAIRSMLAASGAKECPACG
jgi:hypothetical protein